MIRCLLYTANPNDELLVWVASWIDAFHLPGNQAHVGIFGGRRGSRGYGKRSHMPLRSA